MVRMALLYDYYGPLLTEKQRRVVEMHYQDDMSLAEIAELERTSRQAVHDILRRAEETLSGYESKLGLAQQGERDEARMSAASALLEKVLTELGTGKAADLVRAARSALQDKDESRSASDRPAKPVGSGGDGRGDHRAKRGGQG